LPAPLDIGSVFKAPPVATPPAAPLPKSTIPPAVAGGEPSGNVGPISAAVKPDVEGNRGKSRHIDVASVQCPATGVFAAVPSAMPDSAVLAGSDRQAEPSAIQPSAAAGSELPVTVTWATGGEGSQRATQCAVPDDSAETPAALLANRSATGPHAAGSVAVNEAMPFGEHASQLESANAAGDAALAQTAQEGLTGGTAVAEGIASEKKGTAADRSHAAGIYRRAEVVGMAVLALAGHHLAQRWPSLSAVQPQQIALRRRKTTE
jgi:hypothetical protein